MSEILEVGHTQILEAIGPPTFPLLKRVICGCDDAIHSLVFEFINGERRGLCLDEHNEPLSIMDDSNIDRRIGADWVDIIYGDYIVAIEGYNLNANEFLCHSVTLQFKSGFKVTYQSKKQAWRGDPFNYHVPPTKLVTNLVFLTNGTMPAIGVNTTSIHLAITRENVSLLPSQHRQLIIKLFIIFNKYSVADQEVCWNILSYICGHHLYNQT
mmetsp:Transcript_23631/g.29780  ORF Transcript_23631/g.29780 Transcript_23631/m.29780 type:complete len:212 (+) Transcript_23631:51-686(+)